VNRAPVPRDIDPSAHPHIPARHDVVEKLFEPRGAAGMPGQPRMKADRHHLGCADAFATKQVQRVAEEGEEVAARRHGAANKLGVVVDATLGNDEVVATEDAHPIGQLVIIGVGVVEKAAILSQEPPRIHAWPIAAIPAERTFANGSGD